MREIVAFVEDIFFTAKIRETAKAAARDVRFIRDLHGFDKELMGPAPSMVIVDLNAATLKPVEIIQRLKQTDEWKESRLVAYSSHVRAELMEEANQAGADLVLPKSGFTQKLSEIVSSAPA